MIGYVTLGTDDLDRARAFYDDLLGSLGAKRVMQFPDDAGGFTFYGIKPDRPGIAVTRPYNREPAVAGNGNMVALAIDSRQGVDQLHALALALGAADEGAPGLRGPEGEKAFYGGYFRDLDGNKLCAFRIGPGD
jgi:catechol 2,3-dioxygenase-like lactoylglutathione lyase family enzyme